MTNALERARKLSAGAALCLSLAALPGCGGFDGVELNGKVFEAVGLTGALGGKKAEPKTEARAPLVLPPQSERLPEPGSLAAAAPTGSVPDPAWPNDPDKRKASSETAKKQAQTQYCQDGNWKERAMRDEVGAAHGPQGSCGNIFSVLGKSLFGE